MVFWQTVRKYFRRFRRLQIARQIGTSVMENRKEYAALAGGLPGFLGKRLRALRKGGKLWHR